MLRKSLKFVMENTPLFDKVIRFVSIRPRSKKEISDYVKRKLYKKKSRMEVDNEIASIMKGLSELNLVNDESFAESFIEWRLMGANPKGFRIIRNELFVKGVDSDLVSELLENKEYKNMEVEAAKRIVSKKSKIYKSNREIKSYLFSRGFSQLSIEAALID